MKLYKRTKLEVNNVCFSRIDSELATNFTI